MGFTQRSHFFKSITQQSPGRQETPRTYWERKPSGSAALGETARFNDLREKADGYLSAFRNANRPRFQRDFVSASIESSKARTWVASRAAM